MGTCLKETKHRLAALVLFPCVALSPALLSAQVASQAAAAQASASPPPSTGGFFPLGDLKRGMTATAWTVFAGTKPEPMAVEILGVLRGVRGPGHDMILAQLHGSKPEYTGVVAGMSGSPGLHRQPAAGLHLLPHWQFQQRRDRRHHAHRGHAGSARSTHRRAARTGAQPA